MEALAATGNSDAQGQLVAAGAVLVLRERLEQNAAITPASALKGATAFTIPGPPAAVPAPSPAPAPVAAAVDHAANSTVAGVNGPGGSSSQQQQEPGMDAVASLDEGIAEMPGTAADASGGESQGQEAASSSPSAAGGENEGELGVASGLEAAGSQAAAIFASLEGDLPKLPAINTSSRDSRDLGDPVVSISPTLGVEAARNREVDGAGSSRRASRMAAGIPWDGYTPVVNISTMHVACLRAITALVHGNSFAKNNARQQGLFATLAEMLQQLQPVLLLSSTAARHEAAVAAAAAATASSSGSVTGSRGVSRTGSGSTATYNRNSHVHQQVCVAGQQQQQGGEWGRGGLACTPKLGIGGCLAPEQQQLEELRDCLLLLSEAVHGSHANQDTLQEEGLVGISAGLLGLAIGEGLGVASRNRKLLVALAGAIAAAADLHQANKVLCREMGVLDALSRLVLMAAEVRGAGSWEGGGNYSLCADESG